jgi:hypothetical protein
MKKKGDKPSLNGLGVLQHAPSTNAFFSKKRKKKEKKKKRGMH